MNYLPLAGYYFYGATSTTERAAFYASWGLLDVAPGAGPASLMNKLMFINIGFSLYKKLGIKTFWNHIHYRDTH